MFRRTKKHWCLGIIFLITTFLAKRQYFNLIFVMVVVMEVVLILIQKKYQKSRVLSWATRFSHKIYNNIIFHSLCSKTLYLIRDAFSFADWLSRYCHYKDLTASYKMILKIHFHKKSEINVLSQKRWDTQYFVYSSTPLSGILKVKLWALFLLQLVHF